MLDNKHGDISIVKFMCKKGGFTDKNIRSKIK